MNVVDSSGWLEFFGDDVNADFFADAIEDTDSLIVPAIVIYEVFKRILLQRSENEALKAAAHMQQGHVVVLDDTLAMMAAKISSDHQLPMADSIILASARVHNAIIWTQDADFKAFPGVQYIKK